MDYDVVVIGGGVVGLACGMKISKSGKSVLLIERHNSFGKETSSRNSEVIHAGIYYPGDSLKAELCVKGNYDLYKWCENYNVPHKRIGKFLNAITKEDESRLNEVFENGKENGVEGLQKYPIKKFSDKEPFIIATEVLFSADTGIVDSHSLMDSLFIYAKESGCEFAWNHEVAGISKINSGYKIEVVDSYGDKSEVSCMSVINSAGLDSDKIASLAGINIKEYNLDLSFCRGHYFHLSDSKTGMINHLIYPVVPASRPGLGVHVTVDLGGRLKLGPDTEYLDERVQNYNVNPLLREKFFDSANLYIKNLCPDDLSPDMAGIRPKLQRKGEEFKDFYINEESEKGLPGLINLIGIESPGLTCCLSIADKVLSLL